MFATRLFSRKTLRPYSRKVIRVTKLAYKEVKEVVKLTGHAQIEPLIMTIGWTAVADLTFLMYSSSGDLAYAALCGTYGFVAITNAWRLCDSIGKWPLKSQFVFLLLASIFLLAATTQIIKWIRPYFRDL